MIRSKTNIATKPDSYSQILTAFMCEIETKNVYDEFSKNKEMFDFSHFSPVKQNTMTIQRH